MVLKPEKEKEAEAIFRKVGAGFRGRRLPPRRASVLSSSTAANVMADLRSRNWATRRRLYDRPHVASPPLPVRPRARPFKPPMGISAALEKLIATPELCSKRWVWEQMTTSFSAIPCSVPAAPPPWLRVQDGPKGLALTRRRHAALVAEADPIEGQAGGGGSLAQYTAVGGRPLAITDISISAIRSGRRSWASSSAA